MVKNIIFPFLATLLIIAGGCSQEDFSDLSDLSDKSNLSDGCLGDIEGISIDDAGYAADADEPSTRVVENGYATRFSAGDECGLFVVRDGNVAYSNVKLTASTQGGNIGWNADRALAGGFKNESYFIYYPYKDDAYMDGKTNPANTTTDNSFFSTLISSWAVASDQSGAGYSASDLMTAKGTSSKSEDGKISLSFSLTHRMTLAVIRIPESVTKYYVDSKGYPAVKTIHTTPGSVIFEGSVKPFAGKAGDVVDDFTYRYLVRPRRSASVSGSFALDEDEGEGVESRRRFTVNIPSGMSSGTFRVFSLYGGPEPETYPGSEE